MFAIEQGIKARVAICIKKMINSLIYSTINSMITTIMVSLCVDFAEQQWLENSDISIKTLQFSKESLQMPKR
jgi:hypothetical protein